LGIKAAIRQAGTRNSKISLSRREAPFLISAGIYGGGGYLGLIGNGTEIVTFEASFEFGGVSAFAFGRLHGIDDKLCGTATLALRDWSKSQLF
jgi:hypothetical protein